ncbi:Uncharacterised protein family (UPF0259) [Amycolatopsis arida]|uniref:Uncharacterized protein family (UPF0259) n=1 Tax=Amycolatopsis arida TaxID=587909 RepID=A0A1I5WC06_9PSEU|nr:YciC family protein [Amycolatopsis arida]TDX92208.1 uncharacterized protein UPF0259 [Amycolatopsis arida]SFQ17228.1 Uncharacterised protein family (UPF0259) [Amycolatopsis arida]
MTESGGWSAPDPRDRGQRGDDQHGDQPGDQRGGHPGAQPPSPGAEQPPGDQYGVPSAPPPPQPGWGSPTGYGKPGVIPLRPLSLGEILDGSISTIRRHPGVILGFSVAVLAVTQLLNALVLTVFMDDFNAAATQDPATLTQDQAWDAIGGMFSAAGITVVVSVLASTFLSGFLITVVGKAVLGRPVRFGEVWAEFRPMLLPLLGLTIVYTVIVTVGLLLCLLPGVWLYVLFSLATPALVLERGRIFQAMGRSRLLVQGSWWRIFGILLLALVISTVIAMIISLPFEFAGSGANMLSPSGPVYTTAGIWLSALGGLVAGAITQPFVAGVTALVYVDQRMRKEGMDIELARAAGAA